MSDRDREIQREERAIYIIIVVACSPMIGDALYHRGIPIDGGTTLCFLIVALGMICLGAGVRAMRSRLPQARVHRRTPR